MIDLRNINLSFNENIIFKNANIFLPNTGLISIFGHSGVGKTTLLKIIINQLNVLNMEIIKTIDRNEIFYVDQFATLYNNMNITNHFKLVSEIYSSEYNEDKVKEILNDVDLEYISMEKLVKTLSVGERKRLSIALAISVNPRLLVIDEPTSSIDYDTKLSLLTLLKNISKDRCVLITSHETDFNDMFDVIYRIENCKIIQEMESAISVSTQKHERKNVKPNLKHISKFKSKKDKRSLFILFVIIVIVLNMISFQQIGLYFTYQNTLNLTETMTNNSIYFVFEPIDRDLFPVGYGLTSYYNTDAVSESAILDSMSNIDHVLEVKPYYQLKTTGYFSRYEDIDTSSSNVKIYDNEGNLINSTLLSDDTATPAVVAYYDNQYIYSEGEKLDGNYIDETVAEQLGLTEDDVGNPITITMEVGMPVCNVYADNVSVKYSYNDVETDYYEISRSEILYDKIEITLQIDGIISDSDYTDYYNMDCEGLIYVDYDELTSIIDSHLSTDVRDDILLYEDDNEVIVQYEPSNYIVLVDSIDNLSQVQSDIETLSSKVFTYSPYSYVKEMSDLRESSFNSNIILSIVYTLIALVVIVVMLYRYNNGQKNKIEFYQNLGLNNEEIQKVVKNDIMNVLKLFVIVNVIFLIIQMIYNGNGEFYGYNQILIIVLFIVISILIAILICLINDLILKRFLGGKNE